VDLPKLQCAVRLRWGEPQLDEEGYVFSCDCDYRNKPVHLGRDAAWCPQLFQRDGE
jgi:hypothetical protein